MSFVFLFLVDVLSGSYGYLFNLGDLKFYDTVPFLEDEGDIQ